MNRFETSSEPGGTDRPAPQPLPSEELPVAVRAWRSSRFWVRGISGLDAYDRYVQHRNSHHPDEPLLDEAEFWRCRWDSDSKNPKARCC
ncbi:MAG: YbdD/YjiX family protein [Propionibacteriaceae bacterium]